jgi:hypothetical protein
MKSYCAKSIHQIGVLMAVWLSPKSNAASAINYLSRRSKISFTTLR